MPNSPVSALQDLKYCGRFLTQGRKRFTGTFIRRLPSNRAIALEYKSGLLQKASSSLNGSNHIKIYKYDKKKNLIKVSDNGQDVFTKEINVIDANNRTEVINSNIEKTYNEYGLRASYQYLKGIFSLFIRNGSKNSGFIEIRAKMDDDVINSNIPPDELLNFDNMMKHLKFCKFRYCFPYRNFDLVVDEHDRYSSAVLKDNMGNVCDRIGALLKNKRND